MKRVLTILMSLFVTFSVNAQTKGFSIYGHEVQRPRLRLSESRVMLASTLPSGEQARPKAKAKVEKWLKVLGY